MCSGGWGGGGGGGGSGGVDMISLMHQTGSSVLKYSGWFDAMDIIHLKGGNSLVVRAQY